MSEAMLVADRLTSHFGGLTANLEVCITLARGELHALLGPNGAGKSTCINMLSGDLPPSEGRIHYLGKDITALTAAQRSPYWVPRSCTVTQPSADPCANWIVSSPAGKRLLPTSSQWA